MPIMVFPQYFCAEFSASSYSLLRDSLPTKIHALIERPATQLEGSPSGLMRARIGHANTQAARSSHSIIRISSSPCSSSAEESGFLRSTENFFLRSESPPFPSRHRQAYLRCHTSLLSRCKNTDSRSALLTVDLQFCAPTGEQAPHC